MDSLINKEIKKVTSQFENRINNILSVCESEAEKMVLMSLLSHLFSIDDRASYSFLTELHDNDPEAEISDDYKAKNSRFIYPYNVFENPAYYRYTGLEFELSSYPINFTTPENPFRIVSKKIRVIPQYYLSNEERGLFYMDIGIVIINRLKRRDEYKYQYGERVMVKIDNFDKPLSREGITKENINIRELEREGWKVLRYSSDEIENCSQNNMTDIVKEMLTYCIPKDSSYSLHNIFHI